MGYQSQRAGFKDLYFMADTNKVLQSQNCEEALHTHQFDPTKYQDDAHTQTCQSSSVWSCGSCESDHMTNKISHAQRVMSNTSSDADLRSKLFSAVNSYFTPPDNDKRSDSIASEGGSASSLYGEHAKSHHHHYNSYTQQDLRSQNCRFSGRMEELETEAQSDTSSTKESLQENTNVEHVAEHHHHGASANSSAGIGSVVSPITSARLQPIRQRTRNAIVNITENRDVCLEFLRPKDQEERITEVFLVSSDGMQVTIYQPESSQGVLVGQGDTPLPVPVNCKRFTYDNLPRKYWKKYQYAARFVSLVKSKTPKVILYTEQAKCILMENSPIADFEARFYDGAKVTVNSECVRIIEKTGTSLVLESEQSQQHLTKSTQHMLEYVQKCRKQCMELDAVLSTVQTNCISNKPVFPIILGRRPSTTTAESPQPQNQPCANHSPKNTVYANPPPTMASFDDSVCRRTGQSSVSSKSSQSSASSRNAQSFALSRTGQSSGSSAQSSQGSRTSRRNMTRQIYVNNIGWAVQYPNGEMWVSFNDGTQIGVNPSVTTIKFVDQQGNLHRFQDCDVLPDYVKSKLEKLPIVLEHLLSIGAMRNIGVPSPH